MDGPVSSRAVFIAGKHPQEHPSAISFACLPLKKQLWFIVATSFKKTKNHI